MDKKRIEEKQLDQQSKWKRGPKEIDALRRLIQEGIDSRPGIDSDRIFPRCRKKYVEMVRKDSG